MPTPRDGEPHDQFVQRCIPVVVAEGTKPENANGQCQAIWDETMENDKTYQLNKESHINFETKISAVNEEERSVTAVISTAAVDRDREVLLPKGMTMERFQKNPVVPWAHDSSDLPVGKALWVKIKGKKIVAKVQFATHAFAEDVWQLFKGGFLNAFSVGFIPHDGHPPTPKEIVKHPEWADARFIITDWELLEFSPVPIPANPEALMQAIKSKKLDLSDTTKDIFQESLPEEDFEKHIDCEIKELEDEKPIEPEVKLQPIPKFNLIPCVKLHPIQKDDAEIALEAIKLAKGVMY